MKCKRIFASISAATIMAVSSMNVSAVAPEGYDVNNDGYDDTTGTRIRPEIMQFAYSNNYL